MSGLPRGLAPLVAAALALAVAALFLSLVGANPVVAFTALGRGAFGDALALQGTLVRAVPLLVVGLGTAVAFRAGVWNIGGEGQLTVGALAATALATRALDAAPAFVALPAVLAAGALAGGAWAGIAAALRSRREVSEVLSTILLNFVAALAVAWAVHGPLQEAAAGYPQSDPLPASARLPLIAGLGRVHAGLAIALVLPLALWVGMFRTAAGLRVRAVGLAPEASLRAGISPTAEIVRVLLVSGGLAGLAGAIEVSGVTGRLFENLATGYGFTAIAVALLARLHPLAVIPSALFFAALATGAGSMQRAAGVPAVAVHGIEALAILFLVGLVDTLANGAQKRST